MNQKTVKPQNFAQFHEKKYFSSNRIMGPFFLEKSFSGEIYVDIIKHHNPEEFKEMETVIRWNEAPPHFYRSVRNYFYL